MIGQPTSYDPDCLFCEIAWENRNSVDLVKESTTTVAFWDMSPRAPEHLLVVPRQHIVSFTALESVDSDLRSEIITDVIDCASAAISSADYRLVVNVGPSAGQTVEHLHFHVLGGRSFQWPPG